MYHDFCCSMQTAAFGRCSRHNSKVPCGEACAICPKRQWLDKERKRRRSTEMNVSRKLDALQDLACEHYGEHNALYLIGLVAEHAEEEEVSEELFRWMRKTMNAI